jgi:DNA (cytosine-5)-methyltransferase 1
MGSPRTGGEVAESGGEGLESGRVSTCGRSQAQSMPAECELPIFAPGPGSREWEHILRDYPHLAPALEPNVRCLVNGDAVLVDESRHDQLRSIGNSVVALQAAVAFTLLLESL